MTDFGRDLAAIDETLRSAKDAEPAGSDAEAVTRMAHLRVRRASLTGSPGDHERAVRVVDSALTDVGPWPDLCLLKADLLARVHEVAQAAEVLEQVPGLLGCSQARAVLADVALQLGRYDEADELVRGLAEQERTWDHLVRLAHLAACRGELDRADALYADAEDEITAKSMRAYAWVELERGRWALLTGERGRARAHLETADRAYTGSWRTMQARAELLAAEGNLDEAIKEQERVRELTGRPEADQALAALHERMGNAKQARAHRQAATSAYRSSAERGEARYLHHLVELCASQLPDAGGPEEAIGWGRRDVELRPNHLTRGALAWALHRAGHRDGAAAEMRRALATGMRDPRLVSAAGEIFGIHDNHGSPVRAGRASQ